ncbi:hypothetical protein [Nocardia sp. NPDC004604]|uniref:hypothetical protein n=1 Tax=Nocardia sp. NPDC004604 TaxID=3157013 RepID=UPI0033A8866C
MCERGSLADDEFGATLRLVAGGAGGAANRGDRAHDGSQRGHRAEHVSNILSRLGVRDHTQAADYACDRGLI